MPFDKLRAHNRQAQIPASICVVPGLNAVATPTSRKSDQPVILSPGTFAHMSSSRDEDLDWLYGGTASKRSLSGPASCRTRTGLQRQTHSRGRRHTARQALQAMGPTASPSSSATRRADLVGQAGRRRKLLDAQGNGIRFGSSSGCC